MFVTTMLPEVIGTLWLVSRFTTFTWSSFRLTSEDAPQNDHKIRIVYRLYTIESSTIQTCLKPLAERAMANLLPSLVKTGASSSSNHPPGEVMIKLSWQSPLGREFR